MNLRNSLLVTLLSCSLVSCASTSESPAAPQPNIIFMIGDGMGNAVTSAYRYYSASQPVPTALDELLVGSAATWPDDDTVVTDSAAAATALATGTKTNNRMLSQTPDGRPLVGLMAQAKRNGYYTGLVSTVQLAHATPAAFYAHNSDRGNYSAIADDFVDQRSDGRFTIDVAIAGGLKDFRRDDRDLVAELSKAGYQFTDSLQQLDGLTRLPAIGLLSRSAMPYAIDQPQPDKLRLSQMTSKALSLLSAEDKPFALMVEGGEIDWCGHDNDIACMMAEMTDFVAAVEVAKRYVAQHPNTLLVVTADHNTGGLSVGGRDKKKWLPDVVAGVTASVRSISSQLLSSAEPELPALWLSLTGFALAEPELNAISAVRAMEQALQEEAMHAAVRDAINRHSYTGWTTLNHTADDVPVYAVGAYAEQFRGMSINSEIGLRLKQLVAGKG